MTTLTYIRHAQQECCNYLDPPIIKDPLPLNINFDFIICSPYLRCRQTAIALNVIRNKPIYVDTNLSEFLGKHNRIGTFNSTSTKYGVIPINESFEEFDERLNNHIDYVLGLKNNVLIITHSFNVKLIEIKLTGKTNFTKDSPVPYVKGFTFYL